MMRSLYSGVSGLRVHQTKMDVIANNIANVNTVGYKSSRVTFNEVFSQTLSGATGSNPDTGRGGTNPMQIGLGANVASIDKLMTQGAAQRTDNPFDTMIQGDGFYIVGDNSGQYFTRAGAFDLDASGYLNASNGMHVMGWNDTDPDGTKVIQGIVKPIQITPDKEYLQPTSTKAVNYTGNINAADNNGEANAKYTTMTIYDSVGNSYVVDTQLFYNSTTQKWTYGIGNTAYLNGDRQNGAVALTVTPGSTLTGGSTSAALSISLGAKTVAPTQTTYTQLADELQFDSNGKLVQPAAPGTATVPVTGLGQIIISVAADPAANPAGVVPNSVFGDSTGTGAGNVIIDFSGLTQFGNETSDAISELGFLDGTGTGNKPGTLSGVTIGSDGVLTGRYSNGLTKMLGQIPVAQFKNAAGLEKVGDNLFAQTNNSGSFDGVGVNVQTGGGSMLGGVLEMSNVDLSSEFTEMITTQRGFQANSRTITTSDEMLQELVNLKR